MPAACEKRSGWMTERPPHILLGITGIGNPLSPDKPLLKIIPAKERRAVIGKGGNPVHGYGCPDFHSIERSSWEKEDSTVQYTMSFREDMEPLEIIGVCRNDQPVMSRRMPELFLIRDASHSLCLRCSDNVSPPSQANQ